MDSMSDIKQLLLRLNSQVSRLEELKNDIPKIEIDITLELLRRMYEQLILVQQLKNEPETIPEKVDEPLPESLHQEVDIPEPESTEPEPVMEAETVVFEEPVEEIAKIEALPIQAVLEEPMPEPEVIPEIKTESEYLQPAPEPEPVLTEPVKPVKTPVLDLFANETIADKYKDNGNSLADKIKEQKKDTSVAEKIQAVKVTDIKSVIGINEKFLFINKLFDGSLKDYNNALENLNNFENMDQVNNYLRILSETFRWDPNNQALGIFKNLIGRRFL